jgi:uncharacterized protein
MGVKEKSMRLKTKLKGGMLMDRRAFVTGSAAIVLDPPIPSRLRIRVAVFGDSASDGLWSALRDETPKGARYSFLRRGKVSSGLTQPSFFDWPARANELAVEEWGAGVVLLGLNDNLPIKVGTKWLKVGQDGWRQTYGERAAAVTHSFTQRKIPLVWVGPPSVRARKMDEGMHIIHDVLAGSVPAAGGVFLPIRELTLGPGEVYTDWIDAGHGKIIHLRHSDGMHFSESGDRFLARYVLNSLRSHPMTAPVFS